MLQCAGGGGGGQACVNAVPLTKDIWDGVHEIAHRLQSSPAEILEQLVVRKIAELGLLPCNGAQTSVGNSRERCRG